MNDQWAIEPVELEEPADEMDIEWDNAYTLGVELAVSIKIIVADAIRLYQEKNPDADSETAIEAVWAAIYDHV